MHTSIRAAKAVILAVVSSHVTGVSSLSLPFRRQSANPTSDPFNFQVANWVGDRGLVYTANVTVDGQSYEVQLDTGSSDLWIDTSGGSFSNATNTTVQTTVAYEDKSVASGDILIASTQFGDFSIPQQAFINAPGSNATDDGDRGLLGLGPSAISAVYGQLNGSEYNGQTVMHNLFGANPDTSTYITFLLARSNLGQNDGGIFTIGEIDSNWQQVADQPQLQVLQYTNSWSTFMDGMTVNGKNYSGHGFLSSGLEKDVSPGDKDKLVAIFDTGTAAAVIPQYYFDAIYKDIPGSKLLDKKGSIYQIPCDTKINVTMSFNGTEVPINPLDLTMLVTDDDNETICVNTLSPGKMKEAAKQYIDFTLGDAFLRNVYILYNYGNWTSTNSEPAYIQLLPTTIQSAAWEQFDELNQARIDRWNQLGGEYNASMQSNV